ncbi:MAG: NFACT RNA binding domain-containing protein [Rhodothermaceae bacterium]
MFKNYFYLARLTRELNRILSETVIQEIYSQEKDRLYLRISTEEFPNRHLVISADQNFPFISIKEAHFKAKKNTVDFFSSYLPARFSSFEIAGNDRVLKLNLEQGAIYFFIRGNNTNVIIDDGEKFNLFKKAFKSEPEELFAEIKNQQFAEDIELFNFDKLTSKENFRDELKLFYPVMGKEIVNELLARNEDPSLEEIKSLISTIVFEILDDDIVCFYDKDKDKAVMIPEDFHHTDNVEEEKVFEDYQSAIKYVARLKYRNEALNKLRKSVNTVLKRELNKVSSRLNKLRGRIESGSKEEEYYHYGNLLLTNIYQLKKGMNKISLEDYVSGAEVTIKLDDKKSPQQNIDRYFEKARDEKINFEKSQELYNNSIIDYERLLKINEDFENCSEIDELKKIATELKIKDVIKGNKKVQETPKFKHYLIENKYHVYVGKDSKSNDQLSIKFAKQNDYWFHARGLPGSHVVLRVENTKEVVPKNVLKSAASLAAFHSKAKTAGTAPVSYCFAKFVTKKKGMAPGQVNIQKEKVLLVKPGIPANCEYIEE